MSISQRVLGASGSSRSPPDGRLSKIAITVTNGTVTLDGTVDAYHERALVEDAARSTEGVREVIDNVRVV